jgi:hypothetical protein
MILTYRTVIQAVPPRIDWAKELKEKTGGTIHLQPPFIHVDDHYINVLESVGEEEYLVRLEDDAILAPDYQEILLLALMKMKARNFAALMLFNTFPEIKALEKGHEVLRINACRVCSGVALVYDTTILKDFIAFYKTGPLPTPVHKFGPPDATLGMFLQKQDYKLGLLNPSIVQHREGESFLGHGWKGARQSQSFWERYQKTPNDQKFEDWIKKGKEES